MPGHRAERKPRRVVTDTEVLDRELVTLLIELVGERLRLREELRRVFFAHLEAELAVRDAAAVDRFREPVRERAGGRQSVRAADVRQGGQGAGARRGAAGAAGVAAFAIASR